MSESTPGPRARSFSSRPSSPPLDTLSLVRTFSVQQWVLSNELLNAIEGGEVNDVRIVLMKDSEALRKALLVPSLEMVHALRTPLMAAAATGDGSIYSTIYKAMERACPGDENRRKLELRLQLDFQDKNGMTLVMLAARSGSPFILQSVLYDMNLVQVAECWAIEGIWEDAHMPVIVGSDDFRAVFRRAHSSLLARDHVLGQTVLAHAASSGNGSVFQAMMKALEEKLSEREMIDQLECRCGSSRTLLMIAAASGGHMSFNACAQAIKDYIPPSEIEELLMARDSDGMTFLMHACTRRARSSVLLPIAAGQRTRPLARGDDQGQASLGEKTVSKENIQSMFSQRGDGGLGEVGDPAAEGRYSGPGVLMESTSRSAKSANFYGDKVTRLDSQRDIAVRQENNMQRRLSSLRKTEYLPPVLHPSVPVVKAAVALIWECLWKEEVREQFKATDSWGRSVITHAVYSGSKQVFEVIFDSVRQKILAEEVDTLLGMDEKKDETLTNLAIRSGGKELEAAVSHALQRLKSDVELRARASTIEAKIQSFIPGKLIVIFQLLLPEVGREGDNKGPGPLYLLLVICAFSPLLSWASGFLNFGRKSADAETYKPRTTLVSYFLSAPAMFVWGIGTSDIGKDSFGWKEESLSATVLAVGTIVIPAVDAFGNSVRFKQCKDKLAFKRRRFQKQRDSAWKRAYAKRIQTRKQRSEIEHGALKAGGLSGYLEGVGTGERDVLRTPSRAFLPAEESKRDVEPEKVQEQPVAPKEEP